MRRWMWAPGSPCTTWWLDSRSRKCMHSLDCLGGLGAHPWGVLPAHWRSSAAALPAPVIIDYANPVSIPSSSTAPCIIVHVGILGMIWKYVVRREPYCDKTKGFLVGNGLQISARFSMHPIEALMSAVLPTKKSITDSAYNTDSFVAIQYGCTSCRLGSCVQACPHGSCWCPTWLSQAFTPCAGTPGSDGKFNGGRQCCGSEESSTHEAAQHAARSCWEGWVSSAGLLKHCTSSMAVQVRRMRYRPLPYRAPHPPCLCPLDRGSPSGFQESCTAPGVPGHSVRSHNLMVHLAVGPAPLRNHCLSLSADNFLAGAVTATTSLHGHHAR